jgi:RimJ/RimL family protein N-acetyltransferase
MGESLATQRALVEQLLTPAPSDAVSWHFALEHDTQRTRLHVLIDSSGRPSAFVAICQTGLDLFRPFVVMRGRDESALREALRTALTPGRSYLFSALPSDRPALTALCDLESEQVNAIYTLRAADFQPVVNVLVQTSRTPDGMLRAVIRARDGATVAEAGTSWISARYAEVFVRVVEAARGRGLGKSVVSAVCAQLLESGRTPLYIVSPDNQPSVGLAVRLGFRETGAHELSGVLRLKPAQP